MNWFAAPVLISACYHVIVLLAVARRGKSKPTRSAFTPPVSILKPVLGGDAGFYRAIASHATQQ